MPREGLERSFLRYPQVEPDPGCEWTKVNGDISSATSLAPTRVHIVGPVHLDTPFCKRPVCRLRSTPLQDRPVRLNIVNDSIPDENRFDGRVEVTVVLASGCRRSGKTVP